jgi:hypothetical protein
LSFPDASETYDLPVPRRPPISPRTIGLILLVLASVLVPLLKEKVVDRASTPTTTTVSAEPRLSYTKHARERFAERRISEQDAIDALSKPARREYEKPGEDGGEVYKYTAPVHGRDLVIVAETKGDRHTIITGYWDD